MRRVWVARLDRDRHDLHRVAKCDRSETLGDRFGLVALLAMLRAAERCENARVVGERDRALVIEAERAERLDRVENELLCLSELAAMQNRMSTSMNSRQKINSYYVSCIQNISQ